ncbi:MAG: DUF3991 domain-containing protein [Clostridiales bacterium]|nr:DUF3991 domain-containing protein [Clostridiales bacterium]
MQSLEEINIYNNIIKDSLCHNEKRWIGFLKSSAYLYKYPFENQISIYGSSHKARMDSDGIMLANLTACATAEQWNRLGASINENAKGISIIKDGKPTEVYDISDTNSATKIWQTYDSPDFYSILARRTRTSAVDLKGAIDECISRFVDNESINFSSEWTNGRNFQINSIKLIVYTRCGIDTNSIDLSHMNFNSVFGNDSLGIDYANKYVVSPAGDILRAIERSVREYENSERNKAKTAEQSIEEDVLPQEQPPVKEAQIRPNPEQKISEQSQTAQQQRKNNIIGNTAYRNIRNKIYRRMAADVGERLSAELDSTEIKYSGKINNDNTITFTFGGADIESVNNIIFKVNGNTREKKEAEKTLKQQSKPKHRSFTYEELNIARNTDLVDFLSRQGEELKKVGQSEYTMKAHDSMRINGNKYYWNSRSFGGNALDFCMKYYGMSFQDSVAQLLAYNGYSLSEDLQTQPLPKPKEQPKAEKEEKKTEHPEPIPNPVDTKTNRVYAYLTKTRGISPDIVNKLINDGLVVQDVKGNAVFKIFDDKGELSGAEINGTTTGRRFKELTEWKGNTFVINPTGGKPEKAIFVESAIDAVSFHNLNREDTSLIVSMAGLKHQAVLNTMNRYGLTAENCLIASDNDEKGIEFMKKMKNEYNINSYPIVDDWHYAAHNINGENIKDWNELLIAERNIVAEYINDYLNSSEIFTPNIEYSKLLNISAEFYDYDESEHNVDSKAAELVNRYRNGENIFVELGKYLGYDSKIDTRLGSVNMSVKESEEGVTFSYGSTERFLSWEDFGKGQMDYLKNYFIDYLQDLYNKETMPVINDYGVDLNDWENSEESIREVERLENLLSRLGGKEIVLNPEGAFYEIYGENAKTAADILGLNLTYKNIDGVKTPIVGFPYFALDRNVKKLSVNGYTVNINENTAQIEQTKNDNVMSENMPDNSISIDDRNNYGYTSDELLPLNRDKALELFDSGISVYLLYNDNSEALAESREDIEKFDGIFGIEADEWENVLRNEQNIANEVSVDKLSLPFAVGDSIVYANGDKEHLWTVTNIDAESNRVTLSRETGGIVISQETVNKYIDEVVEYFNIHNAEFIALKAALENHEPVYLVSRGEIFHNPRIEYTDSEKFRIASDVEYGGLPAIHAIRLGNMDVISLIKYIKDEGYVVDYSRLGLEKATQIEQKKEIELSENNDTFEYQGYHFRPVGTFLEKDDFNSLSRNINSHSSPYMSVYDDSEIPYSHGEFYSASNNSTADIFLCIETGKVFAPGENELFEFTGEYEPYLSAEKELTVNENIAQNEQEKETTAVENETFIPEYIYKMEANPQTTGREDLYFIQSYLSKENGKADIGDILYMGTPEKCQDIMEQLKAGNITQEEVKELYAKEQSEQSPIITEQINSPTQKATSYEENKAQDKELTELQKKSLEIFEKYRNLPLQNKVGIIAQAFGCKTGEISTTPCGGKWRGTSDVHIRFDNGVSLFIGNSQTSKAKTAGVQTEFVDSALKEYNPEIIKAAKEAALPLLLQRETKDNAIATEKDLKPYTLLNVEFNDGRNNKSDGNLGWYYVTLAVDNRICTHIETGLNHDISDGKISSVPKQSDYFTAGGLGGLRDKDADYVFNNVGFSSLSDSYSLPLRDDVRERAEKTLAERRAAESTQQKQESKRKTGVIGNTAYKYISKKIYRKFDNETAEKIASAFNEAGFKYSGIVRDRETTFTFSGNDLEQVQAVIDRITKDIANKKEQPQAVETSFAEQTDGILNSTANGNVVQENQEKTLENSKKTNTNGVIGNINFKYISKKTYRKFDNETAEKIASAFDETGLKYSGKVGEKTTTLTFSGNDLERAQAVIDRITKAEPGKENNAQNEQNILYDDLEKSSENTILRPLNHKEIEDYISIKEEFSDSLVGYELDGYFQFYGKDAQRVSGILKRKEFERQIENNVTSMTAIPAGKYISSGSRWYFPYIKEIWSRGENIYLAEKNKDGSHQLMQYFRSEDYLPLNTIVNIDGRKYNIENVDFSKGMVTLRDIAKVNNNQPLFINEPVDYVRSYYEEEEHEENTFNYRKNITQNKQNISSENSEKSSIHFGLLGNGITAFDTSKEKDGDYLTVAHISNEGVVNFYVNDLKESDKELIQEEADRQKVLFTEDWNKLSNEIKYERILSTANASQLLQISNDKISLEDAVKKYEHSIIFKDEAFPTDINKTAVAGLTKDDIDSVFLKADEPTKDIKYRVYRQFNSLQYRVNRNKRSKSNIDFLKNEYGTYSAAHDFPDGTKGNIYFNNKEMSIVKQGTFSDPDIIFRWADVESRINTLVRENRYFNDEEKEYYPKYLESIKAPQYHI